MLVSEHIGQFFIDHDRVEYTDYGGGDKWVVLIHGQLMPRQMHQPLARPRVSTWSRSTSSVTGVPTGRWTRRSTR